jgi:hypothetical protein
MCFFVAETFRVNELWPFMRENKKLWLAPIKGSAIAPFIYTLV